MTDWSKLSEALRQQKTFSDMFFDADDLDDKTREEFLKSFVLSLHSEVSGLVEAVNYKDHRAVRHPADVQKILYKSVDVYRYVLAVMNLWGISSSTFATALAQKDDFLHYRHRMSQHKWHGQPVVLFDMDDVLAEFRTSFCGWVTATTGHFLDPNSKEYYNTEVLKQHGLNNEYLFKTFIDQHGFLLLEKNEKYASLLTALKNQGRWIQVITARPEHDLTAFYDTYSWLARHGIEADGVAFTPEKYVWLSHQPYFSTGKYFAVDDSAKHAAEYAKHGVTVIVPEKPYNSELQGLNNVIYVSKDMDPMHAVPKV